VITDAARTHAREMLDRSAGNEESGGNSVE
jgi:hypothetical protein